MKIVMESMRQYCLDYSQNFTKSANGTGLGLYISKNIIQAHGGTMWGENNFDGTGATFYFSLPVVSSKMCLPDQ